MDSVSTDRFRTLQCESNLAVIKIPVVLTLKLINALPVVC